MGRIFGILALCMLISCGGGRSEPASRFASATGPIKNACLSSGRQGVNQTVCGCVQLAADQTLSGADQRRGASFFGNPERAHAVRRSDTRADDAFWERWRNFGRTAEQLCG